MNPARLSKIPLALLIVCVGYAVANAQSPKISQVRSVFTKVVTDMEAKKRKVEMLLDDQGQITWTFASFPCLQTRYQARLSDLDLAKITIADNRGLAGDAFIDIPCKRGACARVAFGPDVWPVLGKCSDPEKTKVEMRPSFKPTSISKKLAEELRAALK
jgi:hypothetical protein